MTQAKRRALITVSQKEGITDFAAGLTRLGFEIVSTGGTARALRQAGLSVTDVSECTGFPEILGGRVKTLHPHIHAAILARLDVGSDRATLDHHQLTPFELVVVNLYPFAQRVASGVDFAEAIEEIDIGGPTLIRAAAKNHLHVAVVVDPEQYPAVLEELERGRAAPLSPATRKRLAVEAFRRTAAYDAAISNWFGEQLDGPGLPAVRTEQWQRIGELRYGENPHQRAAWYVRDDSGAFSLAKSQRHEGKAISYNNLLDVAAAAECAQALVHPGAAIIKHCIPCGAAEHENLVVAFERALAGDPLSAFGGILAVNRPCSRELAARVATSELFFEVIHAPTFEAGAMESIRDGVKWGRSCRFLVGGSSHAGIARPLELRSLPGALLLQERDVPVASRADFRVVTRSEPTPDEWTDLLFAWRVIPFVRSNAIVLARAAALVGVGSGQPSRVDAVHLACRKAGAHAQGSVLASDAFFPFADGVEAAAAAGVRAIIQPGGSVRDEAVVEAADRAGLTMVMTGERHFRH